MFSSKTIIASRRYHVYKETSWSNAKLNDEVKEELETDAKSLLTDPYACVIKARHSYFVSWKKWDIFHEKSLAMFIFLLKKKMEKFLEFYSC